MSDSLYSVAFGRKERVLNYACQTYQLSRPAKVGEVMRLIRECQPKSLKDWEDFYFSKATTRTKNPLPISKDTLVELGERLYSKIREVVIPEWTEAFQSITEEDCVHYIFNLTINRTYDGFLREKSLISEVFSKQFQDITFEESDPELDHAGDVDYVGWIDSARSVGFGLQIKPVTASFSFAGYSPSERMRASFAEFTSRHQGKVFIAYSINKELKNQDIIPEIEQEIERLRKLT